MCGSGRTGRAVSPRQAWAEWSFTPVYVTHVNNLIFGPPLMQTLRWSGPQRWLPVRLLLAEKAGLAATPQLGGPQRRGLPPPGSLGTRTSHTLRFGSCWELCALLPSRKLESVCQRGAEKRGPPPPPPRKGRVHRECGLRLCLQRWGCREQSERGVHGTFPKSWICPGVRDFAQRTSVILGN